jgi:hypothetical protein
MGNKLPKHQATSERIKMCPIKAAIHLKTLYQQDLPTLESLPWMESSITIHQSTISISSLTTSSPNTVPIGENFIILSQDQHSLELYFLLLAQNQIFLLKFSSLRQFKDVVSALFISKRPSWLISPICQTCCQSFSVLKRDHHCRYCGKNICKDCSIFDLLEISGFIGKQRLCCGCFKKVKNIINVVKDIQINSLQIETDDGLYFFGDSDSVLAPCLKS